MHYLSYPLFFKADQVCKYILHMYQISIFMISSDLSSDYQVIKWYYIYDFKWYKDNYNTEILLSKVKEFKFSGLKVYLNEKNACYSYADIIRHASIILCPVSLEV